MNNGRSRTALHPAPLPGTTDLLSQLLRLLYGRDSTHCMSQDYCFAVESDM